MLKYKAKNFFCIYIDAFGLTYYMARIYIDAIGLTIINMSEIS